ncbi:molybdopterin molybdotransferase MoeA [Sulfurospirillum barnesii]|uniref:Molybdopterin molybdenumtransferase n=1 Tax=Sulfurospirillum barnesii (strain ATCC 700032 / DSM 10660 / SES-3) TaxID=760154 RepID=I3XXE0_SULBS|nr:molybdopterin molybdotransferase MoeA [Sulfurospirillum barnesii]AFL68614.1 molybdenum cofactor synthesis domain protein [Sulfurospirillum barnesii SES-3]
MAYEDIVSYDDAIIRSLALVKDKPHTEWVSLFDALGRTLAKKITCKKNLPSYNNAAMDGYAFTYKEGLRELHIKKTILAGSVVDACLMGNECYKIMTGAKVPFDADTIVPFEMCELHGETMVRLPEKIKKGNALRLKGEEADVGTILLEEGVHLNSRDIALLASQGIMMVEVYKKLHVAIFSTGDELKSPWENASEDEIYDINALALLSLLKEYGFEAHYCGVIPDNLESATAYFTQMKQYDVVITSGGVSMGEADFVERALLANGFEASFHGINIKPGKPMMMGQMGDTLVASLPGNPLAAYVNTFVFLLPVLKKLQGQKVFHFERIDALNKETFALRSGRVNFVLGSFSEGVFHAFDKNMYGSGMVKPLVGSNALWISDESKRSVEVDEKIKILLL